MIILDEDIINQNAAEPFDVRKKISDLEDSISDLENRVSALEESQEEQNNENV